jgi:spore coat protein CotH
MGEFMKYAIAVAAIVLGVSVSPVAAQSAADFYDSGTIQDIYLDIHPSDWATLRQNYLDNTYYPAQFRWRNITLADVGVRQRGRSSRSSVKPNLKIDFDRFEESQKFLGLKSTTLKANNADASMMKERISMMLFDRMGIPTPRETYTRVYVNGDFFGFYNLIESMDKDFLRRVFNEDAGYLYEWKPSGEGKYGFEFLGDDPAAYSPVHFDPITHEKDPDPKPIVDMVRAINQTPDAEFIEAVSKYLDIRQFLKHVAVEAFLAEYDGILGEPSGMNNFHVYRFAGTTKFMFTPWDKDLTFIGTERSVLTGTADNVLMRRLMNSPEYRAFFFQSLADAANIMGGAGGLMEQTVNNLYDFIVDAAKRDPFKQCVIEGRQQTCGPGEFEGTVEYLKEFARTRYDFIMSEVTSAAADGASDRRGTASPVQRSRR